MRADRCQFVLPSGQDAVNVTKKKIDTKMHFHYKAVSSFTTQRWRDNLLPSFPFVKPDDDVHLIATMKGLFLPQFSWIKTHQCHSRMQMDMTTTNDRPNLPLLDTCQCMSFPMFGKTRGKKNCIAKGWLIQQWSIEIPQICCCMDVKSSIRFEEQLL